jgi:hypothetical protein
MFIDSHAATHVKPRRGGMGSHFHQWSPINGEHPDLRAGRCHGLCRSYRAWFLGGRVSINIPLLRSLVHQRAGFYKHFAPTELRHQSGLNS